MCRLQLTVYLSIKLDKSAGVMNFLLLLIFSTASYLEEATSWLWVGELFEDTSLDSARKGHTCRLTRIRPPDIKRRTRPSQKKCV